MNELALFAGAGGGLLGTHQIGINPVCAIERNEHRRVVLMQRQNEGYLPSFPIWDDVRTFDGDRWRGTIDIISGGFPCQAFSTAARGRNNAKNLWPEMARIVREALPSYVFAENVTAAAIEQAAKDCSEMGYKSEMLSLGAADLGADHVRRRYWLLAYADDKAELLRAINAKARGVQEFCDGVWACKPGESGVANGVARRMDRIEAAGEGQVPVVAAAALFILASSCGQQ